MVVTWRIIGNDSAVILFVIYVKFTLEKKDFTSSTSENINWISISFERHYVEETEYQ